MTLCRDRNGYVSMGFIAVAIILIVMLLAGLRIGKPYYRYLMLKSHTSTILSEEVNFVEGIRKKVKEEASEMNVPLKEENLEVTVEGKKTKVKATWTDEADLWGYFNRSFNFVMLVEN